MKKVILSAAVLGLCFAACDRKQPEGPAERTGQRIDNAADKIHDDSARSVENAKEMGRDIKARMQGETPEEIEERQRRNRFRSPR